MRADKSTFRVQYVDGTTESLPPSTSKRFVSVSFRSGRLLHIPDQACTFREHRNIGNLRRERHRTCENHITITVSPRPTAQIQNRPRHILRRPRPPRRRKRRRHGALLRHILLLGLANILHNSRQHHQHHSHPNITLALHSQQREPSRQGNEISRPCALTVNISLGYAPGQITFALIIYGAKKVAICLIICTTALLLPEYANPASGLLLKAPIELVATNWLLTLVPLVGLFSLVFPASRSFRNATRV